MKILMLSIDKSILDKNSNSFKRMLDYGSICNELHVIVLSCGKAKKLTEGNVFIYPTGSKNRVKSVFDAKKIGNDVLGQGNWVITSQEPFEVGCIARKLSKKYKVPFEVQLHGDFYGNKYWKKEGWLNFFRYYIGRFIIKRANGVRVVSQRIKESIRGLNKNIFITPIFSEIQIDGPIKKENNVFEILSVGNLVPVKNHKLLINVFSEAKKVEPNIRLTIVGEGPLKKELEGQIVDLKLQDSVILAGHQDNLGKYYAQADLFVLTSSYEGWGRVIVEAASFGLPIFMTDVGLAGEFIKDGESGKIIENDKNKIKAQILFAIKQDLRSTLGASAKKAAEALPKKEEYLRVLKDNWEGLL